MIVPFTFLTPSQENELVPGEVYPCPHNVHSERDRLGKGGNGTVVKFPLGGTEYALKQVRSVCVVYIFGWS